jgi:hypothetical protein
VTGATVRIVGGAASRTTAVEVTDAGAERARAPAHARDGGPS